MKYILILMCLLLSACFEDTIYVTQLKDSKEYIRVKKEGAKVTLLFADNKNFDGGDFITREQCTIFDEKNWKCMNSDAVFDEIKMIDGVVYFISNISGNTRIYKSIGFFD